jgi:hypothetical protein
MHETGEHALMLFGRRPRVPPCPYPWADMRPPHGARFMLPHLAPFRNAISSSITTAWRGLGANRWHSRVRPCLVAVASSAQCTGRIHLWHTTGPLLFLSWTLRLLHGYLALTPLFLASRMVWRGDAQRRACVGRRCRLQATRAGGTVEPPIAGEGGAQNRATPAPCQATEGHNVEQHRAQCWALSQAVSLSAAATSARCHGSPPSLGYRETGHRHGGGYGTWTVRGLGRQGCVV